MKVLIAYAPFGEAPKVADTLVKTLTSDGIHSHVYLIEEKNNLSFKQQAKKEKELILKHELPEFAQYQYVIVGTPVVSFSSAPIVNHFLKTALIPKNTAFALYATGIGLPGSTLKKMQSLLAMKQARIIDTQVFSSIFPFDTKKLIEVEQWYARFNQQVDAERGQKKLARKV